MRTQQQRDAQTVAITSAVVAFSVGVAVVVGAAYVVDLVRPLPDGAWAVSLGVALLGGLILGARSLRR